MSKFKITNELSDDGKKQLLEMYQHEWWSVGRTEEDVLAILKGSSLIICIIDQETNQLAAFSRILTDYFKFVYVYDVIVSKQHRGIGLGNLLLNSILEHPKIMKIENFELVCRKEMIPFYEKFEFSDDYGASVAMRRINRVYSEL
jgi:GNAT superfamily N-acetyltransferase